MRRSPLAEELEHAAAEGTVEVVALASRRRPRVRATHLPDGDEGFVDVPDIDGRAAGHARALADMTFTHGGMIETD